jgi:hypothetical protein
MSAQPSKVKQTAGAVAARQIPLPPERKIVFAADATAEEKRRGVARLLAARKGDVAAASECAQWYACGVVLENSHAAAELWLRYAAGRGCMLAMDAYFAAFCPTT